MTDCRQPVIDSDLSRRYPETWKAMEKLVESGKARSIGQRTGTHSLMSWLTPPEVYQADP